jgi:nitrous oxidase accessory protein NosD
MASRVIVALLCCLFLLVGAGSFVASPDTADAKPAAFDRTVAMGLTLEERNVLGEDRIIPRAQVAYSQFPYIVGYRGISRAAAAVDDPLVRQQFGYPREIHVEVTPRDVSLDESGYPIGRQTREWIPADSARFVVDSDARTPSGPAVLAFESRDRAVEFADANGGEVVGWDDRSRFEPPEASGETARDRVESQHAEADQAVEETRPMLDRPVETVVGEDEPTLHAALVTADENTTIRLPPGTYKGPIEVTKSVTIRGQGATIIGDGNSTVVTVTADSVAIDGVSIAGVGESLQPEDASVAADREDWDRATEEAYGYADAAITADSVNRLLVTRTTIETPASGIILRDVDRAVVDRVQVNGTDEWTEGFMGVTAIRSPAVVQHSRFEGGRDGVYTHRSSGITIRDNRFIGGRFGTHYMYTSEALFAENCVSGQAFSGIVVMTDPSGIAITNNIVADTAQGISAGGANAYIGNNTVVAIQQGVRASARNSLYVDNTIVGNEVGFRASSIFPTSVIIRNDFAENERHVRATSGPLRVWSHDGEGNYWEGAEALDRRYSPTDPVDGRLHRTEAARTLADAPIVRGLRMLRGSVPGMRGESVIDAEPRATPVHPERLELARKIADGTTTVEEACPT